MGGFLGAAAITFILCWVWVGGYLADAVIWLLSKLMPPSADETMVGVVIGLCSVVAGAVVAFNAESGPILGSLIAGSGLYVAVRLPSATRRNSGKATPRPAGETRQLPDDELAIRCPRCEQTLEGGLTCSRSFG